MRRPGKPKPNSGGRRAFQRCRRSSRRPGRGTRRIRAGTDCERPGRRDREPPVVGRDASLQRARHHRRDRPPGAGGPRAPRVDRHRRSIDRRHARAAPGAATRARVHARAAARQRRQGRGPAGRIHQSGGRHRRHPGCRPRVFTGGISRADRADSQGACRRRVRLAVPGPPPCVPVHALRRQPRAHAVDQRAVQHHADGHGDVLQGDARGCVAVLHAPVGSLRHRAGAHGKDLQARLPGVRDPDYLQRPRLRRREEDHLGRRHRSRVDARQVPIHRVKPHPLTRLFGYARPYRGRLILAIVAMVVYAVGDAGQAFLIRPIVDKKLIFDNGIALMAWGIVGVYFVKGIGSYLSSYMMASVGQRVVMDLRNQLYHHILGQSAGFFAQRTTGQLMSRLINDVSQVQQAVSETIGDLARETLVAILLAGWLFWIDARLTLVCLTGAPLIVYPLVRLGWRVRKTTRRSQEALEHQTHMGVEAFTGHRIVKAFGTEGHETEKFRRAAYGLFRTNMKVTAALSSLPPLMELIGGVGMALALVYGSIQVTAKQMTPGEFFSFMGALLLMYGPAKKLSRVNANLQQTIAAAERIFEMLDTHTEVIERPGAMAMMPFRRSVEFADVSFGYADGHDEILRGVSFRVDLGQMIAIVGRSGAGKTTLVNMLPRFYDVTSGVILIDGVDIRHVTLASLRAQIGIVTQETVLFDDTIATNIAYGSPQASRESIEAAARAANAHEFVTALPSGYDATIGERGQRLSGGQRQRLAIARALLKNAPILVLDEATSALDSESELLVQEALTNLMRNPTSFVIAHRLSTIRRADAIIVLEQGRIVEIGRHDDLLARTDGAYAALYQMQQLEHKKVDRRMAQS